MFFFKSRGGYAKLALGMLACSLPAVAQISPCDLNQDGVVNSADVTLAVNMAVGTQPCTANLEGPNTCSVITVQRVVNASQGQVCITYSTHATTLNWNASTSPNVSYYNVYRGSVSGGPYNAVGSTTPSSGQTTYKDSAVQAGQTYYYVVTTVDVNSNESNFSNEVMSAIPTP